MRLMQLQAVLIILSKKLKLFSAGISVELASNAIIIFKTNVLSAEPINPVKFQRNQLVHLVPIVNTSNKKYLFINFY